MIEVKHGDHKIKYDEESNTWRCQAMKCSAQSLGELRTKLNSEDREDRRVSNIRAFSMDRGYEGEAAEVIITMVDTSHHGVNGYRAGHENIKRREYFSLLSLVILNEKNVPKIERYKRATDAMEIAEKERDAARDALPHPTIEELKKLSKHKSRAAAAQDRKGKSRTGGRCNCGAEGFQFVDFPASEDDAEAETA